MVWSGWSSWSGLSGSLVWSVYASHPFRGPLAGVLAGPSCGPSWRQSARRRPRPPSSAHRAGGGAGRAGVARLRRGGDGKGAGQEERVSPPIRNTRRFAYPFPLPPPSPSAPSHPFLRPPSRARPFRHAPYTFRALSISAHASRVSCPPHFGTRLARFVPSPFRHAPHAFRALPISAHASHTFRALSISAHPSRVSCPLDFGTPLTRFSRPFRSHRN